MSSGMISHDKLASFLLRVGIATVFLYAAVASLVDPVAWIGFLPPFLRDIFPAEKLLLAFSIYEILLAIWIISEYKAFFAGVLAALTLVGIIISNLGALDIIFRDIAILFAALSLCALHYEKRTPFVT